MEQRRRRLTGAALLVALLAGCGGSPSAAVPPPPSRPPSPLPCASVVDDGPFAACLEATLTAVWAELFARTGRHYAAPTLIVPDPAALPGPPAHRAYYDADSAVHVPSGYLADLHAALGDRAHLALAFALAHETGHHVQHLLHPHADAPSPDVETQADCYAGVWARVEAGAGRLDPPVFRAAAVAELRRLSTDPGEVRTHGSVEQRVAALDRGLAAGDPAACDTGPLTWVAPPG